MTSSPAATGPSPTPGAAPGAPATPGTPGVRVIGGESPRFADLYHIFLRTSWWRALTGIVLAYLVINALFALAFQLVGGVANMPRGSFLQAFFFSIQTMGTIGYGAMAPESLAANVLMVIESVTGLITTAVSTGLIFAKFSQSQARIVFTQEAVITPMDGVPTLMFRVGNQRANKIIEAQLRVVLIRTERTAEGHTFYRMIDVPLSRERSPAMSRSWTALHPITPASPLHRTTPSLLETWEAEILVTLFGVDDTSLQPVHAQKTYAHQEIRFGMRHVDILSEGPDGTLTLDLRNFHALAPSTPTPDFPYPPRA